MSDATKMITVTLNTAIDRVMQVDHLRPGAHIRATEVCRYPSGKGVNVSRALARLGQNSVVVGFVGRDLASYFEWSLAEINPGQATNQLLVTHGRTRENITMLDTVSGKDTHLKTNGYELVSTDLQRMTSKLRLLVRQKPVIIFGGSLPGGMGQTDFATLVNLAVEAQARVVLNLQAPLLASVLGIDDQILLASDSVIEKNSQTKPFWMIMVSQHQIASLLEVDVITDFDDIRLFAKRLSHFADWVIVSIGAHDALLMHCDGRIWHGTMQSEDIHTTSTVGSGDCLLAGVLDVMSDSEDPDQALRWGLASGVANSNGRAIADFQLEQVKEHVSKIKITCS